MSDKEFLEVPQADGPEKVAEEVEIPEVKGPLVFSCANCRTLIGDTYSFLTSNEENRTITLASASNIQRSADVYTSKSGDDVGSTYFNFTCLSCQTLLGRYYLTTSKDMDVQREKFTFSVDAITSYELGKAQHGKMPEPAGDEEEPGVKGVANGSGTALSAEHLQELQDIKTTIASFSDGMNGLNSELLKVQQVLFGVMGRIEVLEMMTGGGGGGAGGGGGGRTMLKADQWLQLGPQQRSYGSPDKGPKRLRRGV